MSILLLDVKIHTEFTRFFHNGCRLHCLSSTIGNLSSMLPSSSSYVASRYPLPGTRLSKYLKVRVISLQVVFFDSTWSFYASKCCLHDCRKGRMYRFGSCITCHVRLIGHCRTLQIIFLPTLMPSAQSSHAFVSL